MLPTIRTNLSAQSLNFLMMAAGNVGWRNQKFTMIGHLCPGSSGSLNLIHPSIGLWQTPTPREASDYDKLLV
jgi:hypothetical protein